MDEYVETIGVRERTVAELLEAMAMTGFQGRSLGEAYMVIEEMLRSPGNTVSMGLAGSMSTAGMWKIVKWFIEKHYIDVLVSTGANVSEDIYEAMGHRYIRGTPCPNDVLAENSIVLDMVRDFKQLVEIGGVQENSAIYISVAVCRRTSLTSSWWPARYLGGKRASATQCRSLRIRRSGEASQGQHWRRR